MRRRIPEAFWSVPVEDLLEKLQTSPRGLIAEEAGRRLEGPGARIPGGREKFSAPRLLASQFKNPILLWNPPVDPPGRHGPIPHRLVSGVGDLRSADRAGGPNPQTLLGEPAGEISVLGHRVDCFGHGPLSLHPFGRTLRVSPFAPVFLLGYGHDRCALHDRGGDGQRILLPES
jgi:hypothetical protein